MGCGSSSAPTGVTDPTVQTSPTNPTHQLPVSVVGSVGGNPVLSANSNNNQNTRNPPATFGAAGAAAGAVAGATPNRPIANNSAHNGALGGPHGSVVIGTGTLIQPSRPVSRPLVKPPPYRHPTDITLGDLNNQRVEFWGTRTVGNVHMWAAIRSASEALVSDDLLLASAIMEASNISTPSGSLDLVYDELGQAYRVPTFCYANPVNAVDPSAAAVLPNALLVTDKPTTRTQHVQNVQPLNVRIRINPGDHNLNIVATTADSIQDLKHFIVEQALLKAEKEPTKAIPVCEETRQRIMFMGRELQNAQLLGEVGVDESKVVQVFLRPMPKTVAATATAVVPPTVTAVAASVVA